MQLSQSLSSLRTKVRKFSRKPSLRKPGWVKFIAKPHDPSSRYEVGKLISEGGFGSVFRAKRKRRWLSGGSANEPVVAIKVCRAAAEDVASFISGDGYSFDGDGDSDRENGQDIDQESEDAQKTTQRSRRTNASSKGNQAVKLQRDPESDKIIANEVGIMRKLKSPYVVKLIESFDLPNSSESWIVMELVPLSLNKAQDQNKLTQRLNRIIVAGVLQGLKYLRAKRIIHRDVKVENVVISATGWVKLCDFGCSVQLDKGESSAVVDSVKGTFQYMAPELFVMGENYDYAVDVWSFGQLLYALCFGEPVVKRNGFYDPSYWGNYRKSVAHYYRRLLGSAFLYPDEVCKFEKEVDMKLYRKRHTAYGTLVPFLRSCAVPYPINGPKKDIHIQTPLKRATLGELEKSEYMNAAKLSELKQRQELVRLVADCEDTESVCVDYASI